MFIIRDYEPKDYDQVMRLHVEAMEFAGVYKGDGPWEDDLKDIVNTYRKNNGVFLVGELDGKIIAMGAFKKSGDLLAEVKRMRVSPNLQGKGYGQMILECLEERARKMGYAGFHLETSEAQTAAHGLYGRNGFSEAGRTVIDGYKCILFEKRFV